MYSVELNWRMVISCNICHLQNVFTVIWLMLCANNHLECILSINYAANMLAHTVDVTDVELVVVVWINESCCPMSSTGWLIAIIQANNAGTIAVPCHRNCLPHSSTTSGEVLTPAIIQRTAFKRRKNANNSVIESKIYYNSCSHKQNRQCIQ